MLCKLCEPTTTTTTTTSTTSTTTELVRTTAPTTTDPGRQYTTDSPYVVVDAGRCWEYGLCRVATQENCDKAAASLAITRSGQISSMVRPGGCLLWADGRAKFNTKLESDTESQSDAQLICHECDNFKAPAPEFTRSTTTATHTRQVVTTVPDRTTTTTKLVTRTKTVVETTQRYVECVVSWFCGSPLGGSPR
jgi:hypothetical protein